jgi:ABC-type Mn2+/Zn2+ transport system ATPase subunit
LLTKPGHRLSFHSPAENDAAWQSKPTTLQTFLLVRSQEPLISISPLLSARAVEPLDYLEVGHRKDAMAALLSGGEAQRVAIARSFANLGRLNRIFALRDGVLTP